MSSDKLKCSSVKYPVVDKLFVECLNGVFVFVSYNGVCVAMSIPGPFSLV